MSKKGTMWKLMAAAVISVFAVCVFSGTVQATPPTMYPESSWRLGWPLGKVYSGIPELNGLYHATDITLLSDGRVEFYYNFEEPIELSDFTEWDGGGTRGFAVISAGSMEFKGRTEEDTEYRTGFHLNALFVGGDCELEYESTCPDGGMELAFMLTEPGREIRGRPGDWNVAKYKYMDTAAYWLKVTTPNVHMKKIWSAWDVSGSGSYSDNRTVKWVWENDTMTVYVDDNQIVTRTGLGLWPRQGQNYCLGIGGLHIGKTFSFKWVKFRGYLNPEWLAKTQQYGLIPRVNGGRWGEGLDPQGRPYPQSGDPKLVFDDLPAYGYEAMWKWLKVNLTNYRRYSYGRQVSDFYSPLPVADAGLDISSLYGTTKYEGQMITLDGSGSYDPIYLAPDSDPTSPSPYQDPDSYTWTQVSGTSVALSDSGAEQPTFVAPSVSTPEQLKFKLEVTGANGTSDPDYVVVTVYDVSSQQPPVADAGSDQTVYASTAVTFDGSGSFDPNNDSLTYTWDFGGSTKTGVTTTYSWASTGTYTVTLTVDDGAASDTDTCSVTVLETPANYPPTADAGSDKIVPVDTVAIFDGSGSTDPESDPLTYTWDFGAGEGAEGMGITATYSYNATGTYTVTLTVDDGQGNSDDDTCTVTVTAELNNPPTADAGPDRNIDVDDVITLDGSGSSDPDGDDLTYTWSLDDGTTSTSVSVTRSYTATGTYTCTLTVSDGELEDDDPVIITVSVNNAPTADAGYDKVCKVNESIGFSGSGSTDPDGDVLNYTWAFGDGTAGTGKHTQHTYTQTGFYTCTLTVDDNRGGTDTDICTRDCKATWPPTAEAGTGQEVLENEIVLFDGSGSTDPDEDPLTYTWDFGDGSAIDTGVTVTHVYTVSGTYTVTLTVDDGTSSDDDTCIITVEHEENIAPVADAGGNRDVVYLDQLLTFDGSGSDDPNTYATLTYTWEFGGTTRIGETVTYSYSSANNYTVTLTVDDGELSDTDVVSVNVIQGAAGDLYVAKYGDDSNAGTSAAPFATIQKAMDTATAGQTVIIRAGLYQEGKLVPDAGGTSGNPITYKAENSVKAVVLDTTASNAFDNDYPYIVLDGFFVTGAGGDAVMITNNAATNCTFKNMTVYDNGGEGFFINYGNDCTIENCIIYGNGGRGIMSANNAEGITIINCTIYGNSSDGIKPKGCDSTVKDCIITGNGGWGLATYGSYVYYDTDYNDVWNNTLGSYDDTSKINVGANDISTDPDFADAANDDFHLNSGSPCENADEQGDDMGYAFPSNRKPDANSGDNFELYMNVEYEFDGFGSSDPDGDALTYTWNFGDAETGTGVTCVHAYSEEDIYEVTLTVSDGTLSDSDTCVVRIIAGNMYYVSTGGSNSNPGTETLPWLTLDYAASTVTAGETVIINGGVYAEKATVDNSGTSTAPITFKADNSVSAVVINAQGKSNGFVCNKPWVILDGVTVKNAGGPGILFGNDGGDNCKIKNCVSFDNSGEGIKLAYQDNSTIQNCLCYNNNGRGMLITSNADGAIVKHCTLADNNNDGIELNASDTTMLDCIITGNAKWGIDTANALVATIDYSDIWDNTDGRIDDTSKVTEGANCIDSNPEYETGNYRLEENSPCKDAASDEKDMGYDFPPNRAPNASAGYDKTSKTGESVGFSATGSTDPDQDSLTYTWDFGDGTTATGVQVQHVYTVTGVYTATLTVSDGALSDTDTCIRTVIPDYTPVASAGDDQSAYRFDVVTFDGSNSYDQNDDTLTYTWDFGDGYQGTGETVTHSYDLQGSYTVTLSVSDGTTSDTDVCVISVPNRSPIANAGYDQSARKNESVILDGSVSSDPDQDALTYYWNFGDGENSWGMAVTHSYTQSGDFTVTLTVSDGSLSDDDTCVITIEANQAPTASAGANQNAGVNDVVTFDGSGSSDPNQDPLTYAWDFGDGNAGSGQVDTHVYLFSGTFTVTLTVDDGEYSDTDTCTVTVSPESPPVADAGSDQTVYVDEVITLDGSGSSDPQGDPLTYYWAFGDGNTDDGITVTQAYTVSATYTVTLTVSDGEQTDTDTCVITVQAIPANYVPVADAGIDRDVQVATTVMFDGSGSYDLDDDPLTYTWNFGDGSAVKTGITVTHSYTTTGTFTCTLTVDDGTDSDTDICVIDVAGEVPEPEPPPITGWIPGAIHMHTTNSDGRNGPKTTSDQYRTNGYKFAVVSDHDYVTNFEQYTTANYIGINGCEYSSSPSRKHMVGCGVSPLGPVSGIPPSSAGWQEKADLAVSMGSKFTSVAHPYWTETYDHGAGTFEELTDEIYDLDENCDAIAVYNSLCIKTSFWSNGRAEHYWDNILSRGKLMWGICEDDTHSFGKGGGCVNYVGVQEFTKSGILSALKRGHFYGCWQPGREGNYEPGNQIHVTSYNVTGNSSGDTVSVVTDIGETIQFIGNGGTVLYEVSSNAATYNITGTENYIRVRALAREDSICLLQPFFVTYETPPIDDYEGYDPITDGGAGGGTRWVTNTNDSGAGSLRYVIQNLPSSATMVKFEVGGTIMHETEWKVTKSNITFAGETAPYPGITLEMAWASGHGFGVEANNIIIRHMRFRNNAHEGIQIWGGDDILVDRCSVTWCGDGAIDTNWGTRRTISRCLLAGNSEVSRSYGSRMSWHHNMLTTNNRRQPKIYLAGPRYDFRNNWVTLWTNTATNINNSNGVNIIKNYYGPPYPTESWSYSCYMSGSTDPNTVYTDGNYCEGKNIDGIGKKSTPNDEPSVTTDNASGIPAIVKADCGAQPNDQIDLAWINGTYTGRERPERWEPGPPPDGGGEPGGPAWTVTDGDYYVDALTGDDSDIGNIDFPLASISEAIGQAGAGDKVVVWGRGYDSPYLGQLTFSSSGTSGNPITFMADPGSSKMPVIDGEGRLGGTVYASGRSYVVLDGFIITNSRYGVYLYGEDSDNWIIKNCFITGNELHGIYVRRGDDNEFFNCAIYGNGGNSHGVYVYLNAENNDVTQCTVYGQKNCVYYDDSTGSVSDSILSEAGVNGLYAGGDSTVDIIYSDIWGCAVSGTTLGAGCITSDPRLSDPVNGDFALEENSPCIDAASDSGDMGYRTPVPVTTNTAPVADAGTDWTVNTGELITLDGSDSYDPDDDVLEYIWDLGGDVYEETEVCVTVYNVTGTFTVTLTVYDGELYDSDTAVITVNVPGTNRPPLAEAGGDQTVSAGEYALFSGYACYDPDGDTLTYTWDFDDGERSNEIEVLHAFQSMGTYYVSLTCSDGQYSDYDTCKVTVTDVNYAPVADAGSDRTLYVNEAVLFDGSASYDPDEDEITYTWNFGDGSTALGVTATHSYTATGTYTVTLTVDDGIYSDSDSCTVTVPDGGPTGDIYYVSTTGSDSNPGTFEAPWATLQKAEGAAGAGDMVRVMPGLYDISDGVTIKKSGNASNPRIFEAMGRVILDAGYRPVYGILLYHVSYVEVRGLEIRNVEGDKKFGIQIQGSSYVTVEDCNIYNCIPRSGSGGGIRIYNSNNCTVKNNILHHNYIGHSCRGYGGYSYNNLIEGNEVYSNEANAENSDGLTQSDYNCYENTYRNNITHHNADDGMDLWKSHDNVVEGNLSYENGTQPSGDGNGYKLASKRGEGSGRCTVRYNIAWNNKAAGFLSNGRPHTYYNNVSYGNSTGFLDTKVESAGSTLKNNVSVNNTGYDLVTENPVAADYNAWCMPGNFAVSYNGTQHTSLSAYQTACGMESNSLNVDPKFVNPDKGIFFLDENSPLINAGVLIESGLTDRRGKDVPNGSYPDIGCYEFYPGDDNQAPVADAGADKTADPDDVITFDGTGSSDPDEDSLTYDWDFGEGNTLAGSIVTYSFAVSGNYTVTLTANDGVTTDDDYCKVTILAPNYAPTADAGPGAVITVNDTYTFNGTGSYDPDGDTITYTWNFGDGSALGTGVTVTHAYTVTGDYTVTLTVSDGTLTDTDLAFMAIQEVGNNPPTAEAGADKNVTVNSEVTFDGSASSDPESDPLTYTWNLGDGSALATGVSVTHAYTTSGTYTVTLTVDDGTSSDTDTLTVGVEYVLNWGETGDYYVDGVSGDDNNSGTSTAPFATIQKAADTAAAGETIVVWGNQTYTEQVTFEADGSSGSPITLKADTTDGDAVIDGDANIVGTIYSRYSEYVVIDGFKITNGRYGIYLYGNTVDNWTVQNCIITGNDMHGIYMRDGDDNTFTNCLIYNNGSDQYGVYVAGADNVDTTQCTVYGHAVGIRYITGSTGDITDCIVTDGSDYGIESSNATLTITYSDVWNNGTNYYDCSAGTGCISSDPDFVNPATGDFHLNTGSPCENAASDSGDMGYRY